MDVTTGFWRWAAAFLSAAVAATSAHAACRIQVLADLPLEPNPHRALVQGAVNGAPALFILDTGAWASSMPYPDARRLGVKPDNRYQLTSEGVGGQAHTTFGSFDLKLGQTVLPHEVVSILAMPSLDSHAVAFIGREIIGQKDLELDLPDQRVRIEKVMGCAAAELAYWNKPYSQARLQVDRSDQPAIRVDVLLNGHVVPALLDTGSPRSIVTPAAARTAGGTFEQGGSESEIGGIGRRRLAAQLARFDTFTIGDETIKNAKLVVSDMWRYSDFEKTGTLLGSSIDRMRLPQMLLGADFARSHRVLIANSMNMMVFSYMGGPVFDISPPPPADPGQTASGERPAPAK